ncbi:MAG: Fpg/Nei family DNA glycosylase [Puniceicoccales bacterium]
MPELAEVEYFRRKWDLALRCKVRKVETNGTARIFREAPAALLEGKLAGTTLLESFAAAKQMLFRFSANQWLGLHLGMTGRLLCEAESYAVGKWDHFVLRQRGRTLVFRDPRQFGLLKHHEGESPPEWWTSLPPAILSTAFTIEAMCAILDRRKKSPLKAVLLMQERFPGVGNWMADEILWRAKLHPAMRAGSLSAEQRETLYGKVREVCADALHAIAGVGEDAPPPDLNVNIPDDWLFWHRWKDGGYCPIHGLELIRETIGGRTSAWCPQCQGG